MIPAKKNSEKNIKHGTLQNAEKRFPPLDTDSLTKIQGLGDKLTIDVEHPLWVYLIIGVHKSEYIASGVAKPNQNTVSFSLVWKHPNGAQLGYILL
jgi:hypothetical protein